MNERVRIDRILRLDLVEPHVVVQPRDPLRRLQLVADREAIPRRRPDDGEVDHRRAFLVVRRFDDERVALPVAARLAHVLLVRRRQRRPAVGEDDARVVDHLEVEDDDARRLPDLEAAVVAIRHHRRRHAARAAVVPEVEVEGIVIDRVLAGQRPGAAHLERAPLGLGREVGQQSVRRIDDEIGLALWRGRVGDAGEQRAAELAFRDQLSALVDAAARGGDALVVLLVGPPLLVHVAGRTAEAIAVGAPLQRHVGRLHHVQRGLDVGFAPRCLRVHPALRRLDEVVRLARRAEDRLAVRGGYEDCGCRGAEQHAAHRRHDRFESHSCSGLNSSADRACRRADRGSACR